MKQARNKRQCAEDVNIGIHAQNQPTAPHRLFAMQLTSVLQLAMLTSVVVASPLNTRMPLTPKASVESNLSNRNEFNVLNKRDSGTFYSCSDTACQGSCIPYSIPDTREQCTGTFLYNSFYLSTSNVPYAVYVGYSCSGSDRS